MDRFGLARRLAVSAVSVAVWLGTASGGVALAGGTSAGGPPAGGVVASVASTQSPALTCSTPLKLYDGTNLTGANASISERGTWINLGPLGFDNRTSSFKVGACTVDLASMSNGGGSLYDTCHNPGCVENVMDPGWNNVISSVFIH